METKRFVSYVSCFVVLAAAAFVISCTTTQSPNRQVDDARITAQVKSKLVSDVRPSSLTNISVTTTNGVVTLSGEVESEAVKHDAIAVAQGVPGVGKVNDDLQVQQKQVTEER